MSALIRYLRDNILGLVAIFLALSAGAYAIDVAPRDSVTSKSVRNGAIKRVDLARKSVDGTKVSTVRSPAPTSPTIRSPART